VPEAHNLLSAGFNDFHRGRAEENEAVKFRRDAKTQRKRRKEVRREKSEEKNREGTLRD